MFRRNVRLGGRYNTYRYFFLEELLKRRGGCRGKCGDEKGIV